MDVLDAAERLGECRLSNWNKQVIDGMSILSKRFLAYSIDWALTSPLLWLETYGAVVGAVGATIAFSYLVAAIWWKGTTIGKYLLRLEVLEFRSRTPELTLVQSITRVAPFLAGAWLIALAESAGWPSWTIVVPVLVFALIDVTWALVSREHRAIHDILARTVVVVREPASSTRETSMTIV